MLKQEHRANMGALPTLLSWGLCEHRDHASNLAIPLNDPSTR
jgi:hypothetical protein